MPAPPLITLYSETEGTSCATFLPPQKISPTLQPNFPIKLDRLCLSLFKIRFWHFLFNSPQYLSLSSFFPNAVTVIGLLLNSIWLFTFSVLLFPLSDYFSKATLSFCAICCKQCYKQHVFLFFYFYSFTPLQLLIFYHTDSSIHKIAILFSKAHLLVPPSSNKLGMSLWPSTYLMFFVWSLLFSLSHLVNLAIQCLSSCRSVTGLEDYSFLWCGSL